MFLQLKEALFNLESGRANKILNFESFSFLSNFLFEFQHLPTPISRIKDVELKRE